jgi:hypothetical protein
MNPLPERRAGDHTRAREHNSAGKNVTVCSQYCENMGKGGI